MKKVEIQYLEKLHKRHYDLPSLPEKTKIENIEKLVTNLNDKTECIIHTKI